MKLIHGLFFCKSSYLRGNICTKNCLFWVLFRYLHWEGSTLKLTTYIKILIFAGLISACADREEIRQRKVHEISSSELKLIEAYMSASLLSFVTTRDELSKENYDKAAKSAAESYVSSLSAFHLLPDVVVADRVVDPRGRILDEKMSFEKSPTLLVVKNVKTLTDDKEKLLRAYHYLDQAKLATINGKAEEAIVFRDYARKSLSFTLVEIDVEKIHRLTQVVLLEIKQGYYLDAELDIMSSVKYMKEIEGSVNTGVLKAH